MITQREGSVIAGRYELVRPLASGGMGSLWIARHRSLHLDVAVKFVAPSLVASADARARFEREAIAAAHLDSQHVVQILDYGVENDTPYMVMELLKGESLGARLAREGRLGQQAVARHLIQICKALRTAHQASLVHRDLKPGNIFLALKDEDEVAKVLDFGIAKSAALGEAQTATESGILLGSAHYMSPEQIRDSRKVDSRSDLWSLGVILYRMVTGRLPFPGKDVGDVIVRVCVDPIPLPSEVVSELTGEVDAFFAKALARAPDQRFQSAAALAAAFCAIALDAPPASLREQVSRWNKTVPLNSLVPPRPPEDTSAHESNVATRKLSEQQEPPPGSERGAPHGRPTQPSGAEDPTFAIPPISDAPTESLRLTPRRKDASFRRGRWTSKDVIQAANQTADQAPSRKSGISGRSLWPVWTAAAVVIFAGLLAFELWPSATPPGAPIADATSVIQLPKKPPPAAPTPVPTQDEAASAEPTARADGRAAAPTTPAKSIASARVVGRTPRSDASAGRRDPKPEGDPYSEASPPETDKALREKATRRLFGDGADHSSP